MNSENATVAIVGTGRMAKALGALLVRNGTLVTAVAGRSRDSTVKAARFMSAKNAVSIAEIPDYSRHILIAVSDDAISGVASELAAAGLRGARVLHTSGAAGPEALAVLRKTGNSVGVFHPMQSVPSGERGVESLPGSTFAFAGDKEASDWASRLVGRFHGKALAVEPRHWVHYHAAAVMACNYQVTLVDSALELMEIAGIQREEALDALSGIIRNTVENILTSGTERALTGPIRRGDTGTINAHLEALNAASPETRRLYLAAAQRTMPIAQRAKSTE
jgi:predicted short-subunit dehydrogenase-like oxidoreductase (DUF2520 family)